MLALGGEQEGIRIDGTEPEDVGQSQPLLPALAQGLSIVLGQLPVDDHITNGAGSFSRSSC